MAKDERGESARISPLVWVDRIAGSDRLQWRPGQQTRFTISVDPEQIEERVEAWINRPSSALQLSINESLNEYLRENDSGGLPIRDHNERLARFRQRLSEGLAQSKPLVEIDNSVYATAHRMPLETKPLVQGFPFADGHPAYQIVRETFDESITNSDLFAAGTGGESVLISSFIQYPVHPMVISSICEPLRSAVEQYRNDPSGLTSAFWQFRRTKTLEDYVPLADPVRRAMIRGFVIARLLGYLSIDPTEQDRISTPVGVKQFPYPLLTHVSQDNMLPAILEAFPLTLADAPVVQQEAFSAYNRLYELGKQSGERYALHSDVINFLNTGNIEGEIIDHLAAENRKLHQSGEPNGDKEQRRQNLLDYVDQNLDHFRGLKAQRFSGLEHRTKTGYVEPEDTLTLEIIGDLIPEYERIREAIKQAGSTGSRA